MLYCDLSINGVAIWYGSPCLSFVPINGYLYENFQGLLQFVDTQTPLEDPDYTQIGPGGRFQLIWTDPQGNNNQVPTQAIPAQQFDIDLGGQNCTLSFYTK